VSLWGNVALSDGGLDEHLNFRNFGRATLVLLRITTADGWLDAQTGCMLEPPLCSRERGDCGSPWAPLYFYSFVVICSLVLINIFVAVILENFAHVAEADHALTMKKRILAFRTEWLRFDPQATHYILTEHFTSLMDALEPPLGFAANLSKAQRIRHIAVLNIPTALRKDSDGHLQWHTNFREMLMALTRAAAGFNYATARYEVKHKDEELSGHVHHWIAQQTIQSFWRKHRKNVSMKKAKPAVTSAAARGVSPPPIQDPQQSGTLSLKG
jgi:hypothetical protein